MAEFPLERVGSILFVKFDLEKNKHEICQSGGDEKRVIGNTTMCVLLFFSTEKSSIECQIELFLGGVVIGPSPGQLHADGVPVT